MRKFKVNLLAISFLLGLAHLVSITKNVDTVLAVDPGCSPQTPVCVGSTVVAQFRCKSWNASSNANCQQGYEYIGQNPIDCDSNCSYQTCSTNDEPLECEVKVVGGETVCSATNCNTAGNCCGGAGSTPPPSGGGGDPTPTPTPVPNGTIQGVKGIVSWGNDNHIPVEPAISTLLTLSTGATRSTNPYFFGGLVLNGEIHTLSSALPPGGYERGFSRCYDETTCHDDTTLANDFDKITNIQASGQVSEIAMLNNYANPPNPYPYADFWWHYIPLPSCTISGPTSVQLGQTAQYTISSTIPDPAGVVVDNRVRMVRNTSQTLSGAIVVGPTATCGDTGSCGGATGGVRTFNPQALGYTAGQVVYLACEAGNGPLGVASTLHMCNPFHEVGALAHPQDSNCGGNDVIAVNITDTADAWWQVQGGDVLTGGNIESLLPIGAFFNTIAANFPGLPVFGGSPLQNDFGAGSVSNRGWIAGTGDGVAGFPATLTHDNLIKKVPSSVFWNPISGTISTTDLNAGINPDPLGYRWFKSSGDVTINTGGPAISSNRKIVIFVDGDLTIKRDLAFNDANSFLMVVVSGKINIEPQVVGTPALEGVYIAHDLETSTNGIGNDDQFILRGGLVVNGFMQLRRKNSTSASPAEIIEYGPDILMSVPPSLLVRRLNWKEVAP